MTTTSANETCRALSPPERVKAKLDQLQGKRQLLAKMRATTDSQLQQATAYLSISDAVDQALDKLSEQLFGRIVQILEEKLTLALQEVLEQPIVLKVDREYRRRGATISFHVERNGQAEDIMRGQGGSVVNVLSVGLRMFALTTLDPTVHRRFLVLDEQDCWLRPDLVPRLVKIVHEAGRALGFQVLMISHHDISAFEQYADKIYQFIPTPDGVQVRERVCSPLSPDD
jgi:hypothetical protein